MRRRRISPLSNIMGKEIKEMLTLTTIIPVVAMAILFASLGGMIGGAQDEASKPPTIGLINEDASGSNWTLMTSSVITQNTQIVYNGTSIDDGLDTVSSAGGTALLVITPDFGTNISNGQQGVIQVYWIMKGAGIMDSISSSVVDAIIAQVNTQISATMITDGNYTNPAVVLSPTVESQTTSFKGKTMDGISPSTISSTLSSQSFIVPLVVMLIVMMSGSTIIASMGMEKENKTLETLMTMPVKRSHIVLGKLGGAAVVGLIMAVVYMAGMSYYMDSMQANTTIDLAKYGLVLGPLDYVLVGISLFLAVLGALTLCMLLGALARDYKSAQSLTMPVMLLTMIPFFVLMMKDFNTLPTAIQGALFLIPFTHPMMVMNNLMFDDYTLVLAGIAYEAIFVAVTMAIAVWIFKKDLLVSGRQKRLDRKGGKIVLGKRRERKEKTDKKIEEAGAKEGTPLWKDLRE